MTVRVKNIAAANIGQARAAAPAAARLVCMAFLAAALSGCATAIPLPSFTGVSKGDITGSIRSPSPLSPSLDAEDWRRARGALAVALDPQGNGAPVAWENPQTRNRGSFVPVGQAWAKDDNICRTFLADLGGAHPAKQLQGNACRDKAGDWRVGKVEPWKKI
ncbi:MAG: RT0821/Lpp0805 family surface protein [Beijerinckiaceae bacterium]